MSEYDQDFDWMSAAGRGGSDFNSPQQFQLPTMNQNWGTNLTPRQDAFTPASTKDFTPAPEQYVPNFTTPDNYQPEPSGLSRMFNPNTQGGVDNMFRAGNVGVAGLSALLQSRDNRRALDERNQAASRLMSMQDPNAQMWGSQIQQMINSPAGYLNDPVDSAMAARGEEAARRQAQLSGRPGLGADQLENINATKQKSYLERLKTLASLYGGASDRNARLAEGANRISSTPVAGNAGAYTGFLQALMSGGRDVAAESGMATRTRQDPNLSYMSSEQFQQFAAANPQVAARYRATMGG
jgi:hypothetical protein